jgi:hypothetical protein
MHAAEKKKRAENYVKNAHYETAIFRRISTFLAVSAAKCIEKS